MQARKAVPAVHSTLVFERSVPADIQAVYEAFSDVSNRVVWGTPSSTAVVLYESANFMEGGEDRFKCGSKENPNILATTRYLEIVVNARIVAHDTSLAKRYQRNLSGAHCNEIFQFVNCPYLALFQHTWDRRGFDLGLRFFPIPSKFESATAD